MPRINDRDLDLFFKTDFHNFGDTHNEAWGSFAKRMAKYSATLVQSAGKDFPFIEILKEIGAARHQFAAKYGHVGADGVNTFGELRSNIYALGVIDAASARAQALNLNSKMIESGESGANLSVDAGTAFTFYFKKGAKPIVSNINASFNAGGNIVHQPELDASTDDLLNSLVKARLTVEPDTFYKTAKYDRYFFCADNNDPLTSYYFLRNTERLFLLVEHTTPKIAASQLTSTAEGLYQSLISESDTNSYLQLLARLLWLCHQLMPFDRGSASILSIFEAGMLISRDIVPKQFPGTRIDVDAQSLTTGLFQERFLSRYHPE